MTRSLLAGALAAALVPLAVVAAASPASAAPTLSVSFSSSLPVAIPVADGEDFTDFDVTVHTDSPATNVTLTATGDGIVAFRSEHLDTLSDQETVIMYLAGSTPGLHTVTVTATADGAAPAMASRANVWVPGGTIPGGGDLTGHTWGYQGFSNNAGPESSVRDTEMLSFVSPTYVFDGMPPSGRPVCTHASRSCLTYSYDPASGLVQVDNEIIGQVLGSSLYTDGFIPADLEDGELYSPYTAKDPIAYLPAHTRLSGHWRFKSSDYPYGLVYEDLTLRKSGTYALSFRYDDTRTRHLTGTYAVTGQGKVTFRQHHGPAQTGTLQSVATAAGRPEPAALGVWLTLVRNRHYVDGNLLQPLKK
jgi:hypothetical protein